MTTNIISPNGKLTLLRSLWHIAQWIIIYLVFTVFWPTFPSSETLFLADGFPITWNYLASIGIILATSYGICVIGLKRFRMVGLSPQTYFIALEVLVGMSAIWEIYRNAPPQLPPPFDGIVEISYFVFGGSLLLILFSMLKRNKLTAK